VEATSSRRDNQSNTGSSEDRGFSRALDDSDARADVRRDETRAPTQERSAQEGSTGEIESRNNRDEPASPENSAAQNGDPEISANNIAPESKTIEGTEATEDASENVTINVSSFAFADIPEFANPFALAQQITIEAPQTSAPLLTPTTIEGLLPSGEIAGNIATQQQNLTASLLDGSTAPQTGPLGQLGQAGQNLANQINGALSQANNFAGSATGEAFETVLSTQTGNAAAQAGSQSLTNLQQNVAASSLPSAQLADVALQGTNLNTGSNASPNAVGNLTSAEGEAVGSFANANQSSAPATPSQQLASLLSGGGNADIALPNQGQVANSQLQQAVQQPVQQTAQPLAQFANAAFANDTLPAFTAQISRNFAAGQDSFNVRLNPSELGRVDVRVINNDDGTVSTQIRVERSETLDLFQRDIRALERTLQQSGVKLGSDGIDLSLKDNGTDQGGNSQAFDNDFDGQGEHAQNSDPALEADDANQQLNNDGLLVDDLTGEIPLDQVQTIYAQYQPGQLNIRV